MIVTTRKDIALEKLSGGYNCAQSVLFAFCPDLGLDRERALRLMTGFGAGMARRQEVCGALSGAIAAIGLAHGRGEGQGKDATDAAYAKVRDLMARFEERRGSCLCRVLMGCDLSTPEGRAAAKERHLSATVCRACVATAAEIADDLI